MVHTSAPSTLESSPGRARNLRRQHSQRQLQRPHRPSRRHMPRGGPHVQVVDLRLADGQRLRVSDSLLEDRLQVVALRRRRPFLVLEPPEGLVGGDTENGAPTALGASSCRRVGGRVGARSRVGARRDATRAAQQCARARRERAQALNVPRKSALRRPG